MPPHNLTRYRRSSTGTIHRASLYRKLILRSEGSHRKLSRPSTSPPSLSFAISTEPTMRIACPSRLLSHNSASQRGATYWGKTRPTHRANGAVRVEKSSHASLL